MTTNPVLSIALTTPLAWIGRQALGTVSYLGRLATLVAAAIRAVARPESDATPLRPALARQLGWMLRLGFPLVALLHVGIGSFLSMQAYFGGTFVDGTGAVVGVGLIRNVAPLLTGLLLAGLFAAKVTAELRGREQDALDIPSGWVADRAARPGQVPDPRPVPTPGRIVAARMLAALIAGPVLVFWAIGIGTVVGWQVAQTLLGVSTHAFFGMFLDMLWFRDVVGVIVKGVAFSLFAVLFACHEGLNGPAATDLNPDAVAGAACRAACLASVAILILNSGWFLLVYHAGPAFGPTLMAPPN